MAPKKRTVLEEVFDFSQWALQDIVKVPLPSVSASDPPPMRWLGVQSLAFITTGRDGSVIVNNAAKRDLHFELGYVDGYRKETHIVMPSMYSIRFGCRKAVTEVRPRSAWVRNHEPCSWLRVLKKV